MRLLPLAALSLLLASCGSNVPPVREEPDALEVMGMRLPPPTGNQDRDYANMMLIQHQSAIDLARRQLAQGSDPELRRMARDTAAAREAELAALQAYLEQRGWTR